MARATAALLACDDELARRVVVDRLHDLALGRLRAGRLDDGVVEPQDGRHGAGAGRDGALHRLAAKAHERDRGPEIERARGDQGAVLAEAVAGQHVGPGPPRPFQARQTAIPAASIAGWVRSVSDSRSSGPCWQSAQRS